MRLHCLLILRTHLVCFSTSCSYDFTTASSAILFLFFLNDTATTEISTLPPHDALPLSAHPHARRIRQPGPVLGPRERLFGRDPLEGLTAGRHTRSARGLLRRTRPGLARRTASGLADRKSTRLNSSHSQISYAVFCLKKK